MSDLSKPEGRVGLALLGGLAFVAVAVVAAVVMLVEPPYLAPPPLAPPPATAAPPLAAPPPATKKPDASRPDPAAWPADEEGQIRATQRLLGALKLTDESPTGQLGPVTQAAIRYYQRIAGLEETGEVSEALFDSLKDVAALVFPQPVRSTD